MLELDVVPQIITFDCYGTLVQWHRAMRDAARSILGAHDPEGIDDDNARILADKLRQVAVSHQQSLPFRRYETVLHDSLVEVLAEIGHDASIDDQQTLLAILRRIEPHAEVPAALARLRSRYRLAIISNTSDDLIADTVTTLGVPIDFVVTAEQAQAYKPDHRLFLHAYDVMGVTQDQTVHVGMGQFIDLKVCHELKIRSVWIDRNDEPLNRDWPPDAMLRDLSELPELLMCGTVNPA